MSHSELQTVIERLHLTVISTKSLLLSSLDEVGTPPPEGQQFEALSGTDELRQHFSCTDEPCLPQPVEDWSDYSPDACLELELTTQDDISDAERWSIVAP